MHSDGNEPVCFVRLWELMPLYVLNLTGPEVKAIRDLYCAVPEGTRRGRDGGRILASSADAGRWRAATDAVVRTAERVQSREQDATRHLRPPWTMTRRLLWSVRHARRNRVLRRDHDATMERLRAEMLSAYHHFRDQAADLTPYVEAERRRQRREEKEYEERARRKRAEALANPDVPQWAYCIVESARLKYRCFRVRLETLDSDRPGVGEAGGEARGGLTPREVHAALVEERKRDPYLWLTFNLQTRIALKEWRGSAAKAWQEITGHRVAEHPIRPEDHRTSRPDDRRTSRRSYGPSSNYFSPGGFGTF